MRRLTLVLLLPFLTACPAERARSDRGASAPSSLEQTTRSPAVECQAEWREVDDGVRYRTTKCKESGRFELHLVELDPKMWKIDAVNGMRRAISSAAEPKPAFAINANFFDEKDKALGVVVTDGKLTNPAHPVSWQSVFSVTHSGEASIVRQEEWKPDDVVAASQAGPRLVVSGAPNQVAEGEPSLRSGVCLRDDRVVFFVTPHDSFMTVHEVAAYALKREKEGGIGCRDAMLFDGGPSAQMILDTRDKDVTIEGDVVPVYVVASRR